MKKPPAASWVVALLLCVSAAPAQPQKTLTLAEAIALGKENNKMLRASAARVDAATARVDEAHAALLPAVRLQAGYTRVSDVDPFRVQLPFSPTPIEISPVVLNTYSFRVGVQQPLFTGFRLSSNARAAELLARASETDRKSDRADLVLTITGAYWTLYQTRQTKTVAEDNVARLESYRADTEHLLKAGLATQNDRLRIEVQLANARLQLIDAVNDVQVAMMNLNSLIGLPLETQSTPASVPGAGGGDSLRTVPFAASSSFLLRPDLQSMQTRIEAAKENVAAAQSGWWPQLSLAGNYYLARPNPRFLPTLDKFRSTWDVGVSLQWDVWTWLTPLHQTDQARAQLRQNELTYAQLKDNAELELTRAGLAIGRAREKIAVAETGVSQAEENVRILNDKYRNGLATSTELLDAQSSVLQAKTNLTGANVELEVAFARLKKARGLEE